MPVIPFRLHDTPDETLQAWSRRLNYIFNYLDDANVVSAPASTAAATAVSIVDSTGYYVSNNVEGALEEVSRVLRDVKASTVSTTDAGGYYATATVEGNLQEIGKLLYSAAGSSAATIPNYGLSLLSATTGAGTATITLTAPTAGLIKMLHCSAANSSDTVLVYTGSTATFFGPGAALAMEFNTAGQAASLVGVSTARWAILSLGSTTVTATLPVLSTIPTT